MFVFIMQFFWKYIDDLVGKGLEMAILAELTFYLSATVVPIVIPLAILLASIITFGNLGEHYELVALKSAGISFLRFMMPLFVVILFLSCATFYFANNILPVANLKFGTLLYSVVKKRPAINIKEDVFFHGVDGYIIKIGAKDPDNITIHDVNIWDNTSGKSGQNLLKASKGIMQPTTNDSFLIFKLYDGWKYEELKETKEKKGHYEHIRTAFKELELVMDMSNLNFEKKDEKMFSRNPKVMPISGLKIALDSLEVKRAGIPTQFTKRVQSYIHKPTKVDSTQLDSSLLAGLDKHILQLALPPKEQHSKLFRKAKDNAKSIANYVKWEKEQFSGNSRRKGMYHLYIYNKFALAFSCIVLFLIGAPMGAIIRKGGLGLPMVISIVFFMIFHILTTLGRKLAEEGVLPPFHGVWLAVYILLPIAIFLTYKSSNDSVLFNPDMYWKVFNKYFKWLPFMKKK